MAEDLTGLGEGGGARLGRRRARRYRGLPGTERKGRSAARRVGEYGVDGEIDCVLEQVLEANELAAAPVTFVRSRF